MRFDTQVLSALATTVLGAGAMFTMYTYIAPVLVHLNGASTDFITLALVLTGVGFTIGNAVGGKLSDQSLNGSLIAFLAALAIIMLAVPLVGVTYLGAAAILLLWGAATFAIVPPVQIRVMQAAKEAPGLASSINIGAFNLGNALGAALGGAVISTGLGYSAVPVAGGLLAASALLLVLTGSTDATLK